MINNIWLNSRISTLNIGNYSHENASLEQELIQLQLQSQEDEKKGLFQLQSQ